MDANSLELAKTATEAFTRESVIQGAGFIKDFLQPKRIKKIANAEGEAMLVKLQTICGFTREEAQGIYRTVLIRNLYDANYSEVVGKAFALIDPTTTLDLVNEDWLLFHYSKASQISQNYMQDLWAKILAGEINKPGSFSKQTLSILELISIKEAVTFEKLSSFLFNINNSPYIVFHTKNAFKDLNLDFSYSDLIQLQSLGLISIDSSVFGSGHNPNFEYSSDMPINCSYYDKEFKLIPIGGDGKQPFYILNGIINLTQPGIELIRICDLLKSEEIMDYTFSRWNEYGNQVITE